MALHGGQVRYQADVNRRLKSSVKDNVGRWIAGALVTGGVISLLPMRERKIYVNPLTKAGRTKLATPQKPAGGFWASFFKALVPLFKPLLTAFVTKQLANGRRCQGDPTVGRTNRQGGGENHPRRGGRALIGA